MKNKHLMHSFQKYVDCFGRSKSKIPFGSYIYSLLQWTRSLVLIMIDPNKLFINQLLKTLNYHKIDLVIDVGAGEGEFALELIRAGYKRKIISIEPLIEAHDLLMNSSKKYRNWMVFPRMAIGDTNKIAQINVSSNSVSSSLLDLLPAHLKAAKDSKYIGQEVVPLYKLDHFIEEFNKYKNILIKIDAQGYEHNILKGADRLLHSKNLKGLFIEVSFVELYKGQKKFDYLYRKMIRNGFEIWGIEKVLVGHSNGRLLQSNFLMFRSVK